MAPATPALVVQNGSSQQAVFSIYDRYEREGLTSSDTIEATSATYGIAVKPTVVDKVSKEFSGDKEEILAQWQDPMYCFDLVHFSHKPKFRP